MAYSEMLADRVRELLVEVPRVQEKKMFRGISFLINKKMCVNISLDRLMCRVDPSIHDTLVEKDGCVTVTMRGRDLKGWVYVDENVLRTQKDLRFWVDLALAFNKNAKASVKKKPGRLKKKNSIEKEKMPSKKGTSEKVVKKNAGGAKKRKSAGKNR